MLLRFGRGWQRPVLVRPVLVLAVLALLVVGTAGHASAAPDARPQRPCSAGWIALTFDDGPSRTQTPRLVDILLRNQVPATFFMVGSRVASAPAVGRMVARRGFVIGNHTWSHPQLPRLDDADVRRQLVRTGLEFRKAQIPVSRLMRPPYGAVNPRVRSDVARLHLTPVLWTVDSEDWVGGTSRQIAARILAQLRPHRRNVVLQHDGINNSPASVGAVPIVIRQARQRGYCFADLDDAGRLRVPSPHATSVPVGGPAPGPETGPASGQAPVRIGTFDPWYDLR